MNFLKGYLHVVYNGSLYYHQQGESRVIRYELASERNTMVHLPNATVTGNVHLYSHVRAYNHKLIQSSQFSIYALSALKKIVVAKLFGFFCRRNWPVGYLWRKLWRTTHQQHCSCKAQPLLFRY